MVTDSDNVWHVYPNKDLKPHDTDGFDCACNPEIKDEGDFVLVVHKAYDKRDKLEAYNMGPINQN